MLKLTTTQKNQLKDQVHLLEALVHVDNMNVSEESPKHAIPRTGP